MTKLSRGGHASLIVRLKYNLQLPGDSAFILFKRRGTCEGATVQSPGGRGGAVVFFATNYLFQPGSAAC